LALSPERVRGIKEARFVIVRPEPASRALDIDGPGGIIVELRAAAHEGEARGVN